ncbi:MAG: hypothetical protein JSV96_03080 [Candidatus Aminicenantes bacterium]|nr:MAG: hypothetical protein JSV96_03080 [Candidatus Aminicenantes bacterium]
MARNVSSLILCLFFLLTSTLLCSSTDRITPSSNKKTPLWWEVKVVLDSKGNYSVKEGLHSYPGNYSFIIVWTGFMEKDNGDFILYHEDFKLLHWEAQEISSNPEILSTLSTGNFSDKPFLNMNYILKKEENLYFDFSVNGFCIPQNESEYKFYLYLPVSEENSERFSEIDYDAFVFKGSNRIFLEEKKIYTKSAKKDFCWNWRYQGWQIGAEKSVFLSHIHEVKVEIFIIPRFKKR